MSFSELLIYWLTLRLRDLRIRIFRPAETRA
jgi:hypothetical protein